MRLSARLPRSGAMESGPLASPGEVHFLWWFIQGSIMEPDTRQRLWRGWGMCERHSLTWLAVEAAFRHGRMHGPAILYAELMARVAHAFSVSGRLAPARLARRLLTLGPCLMCELRFGPDSKGFVSAERLARGRDQTELRRFMAECEPHWRGAVCGRCAGTAAAARCRIHLLEDLDRAANVDLAPHRTLAVQLARRAEHYSDSFRWERQGTDTPKDRAALVSAVGWCSGWRALLATQ